MVVVYAQVHSNVDARVVSVTADPGLLSPSTHGMDRASSFHSSIVAKWGASTGDANWVSYLLPLKINPQADPLTGTFSTSVTALDIAGQEVKLSGSSGAQVKVVETRKSFNVYLMPGLNFISTPLECPSSTGDGDCAGNFEFDISDILNQTVANSALGATATGGAVAEIIYYY